MKRTIALFILSFMLVWLSSCDTAKNSDNLSAALKEIIEEDEVISLDALDDGGAQELTYDYGSLAKAVGDTLPVNFRQVRFGRKITAKPTREIELNIAETTAVALVTTTVTGKFKIVFVDTVQHTAIDSVTKDFTEISYQKLKLQKVRNTDNPKKDWQVVAVSPIIGRTVGNTIEIESFSLKLRNSDEGLELANDANDSLLDHFIDRQSLIKLRPNGAYNITIAIENTQPFYQEPGEFVTVNFGIKMGVLKFRRPLLDQDNDNIYTGVIMLHGHRSPMCRLFLDVIDYASIFVKSAPFNATFWAFPHWVKY